MAGHHRIAIILVFLIVSWNCISCTSSSTQETYTDPIAPVSYELVGTWAGWFLAGDDDSYQGRNGEMQPEFTEADEDDIFTIAIITLEREARFIGDVSQYVCLEDSFGVANLYGYGKRFIAHLLYYTWNTTAGTGGNGNVDAYRATKQDLNFGGSTIYSNDWLDGVYTDSYPEETQYSYYWQVQLLNYTSSGMSPDVHRLDGLWVIYNCYLNANTLSLTISAAEGATTGTITGSDTRGNSITGQIIEIHYNDPTKNIPLSQIFRVNLTLQNNTSTYNLTGLATYVESMSSAGIVVDEVLAIGATDDNHLITGLATKR